MVKSVLSAIMVLLLVGILGCSTTSDMNNPSSAVSLETIREAKIGSEWNMKQLQIVVGTETSILLKLSDGDKVDGYFYLEKGDNIDFRITGNSLIYESKARDTKISRGITSDRFSFVASKGQGIAYTLTLSNTAGGSAQKSKVTIFMEIIYPATGFVFVPIEAS